MIRFQKVIRGAEQRLYIRMVKISLANKRDDTDREVMGRGIKQVDYDRDHDGRGRGGEMKTPSHYVLFYQYHLE